MRKRRAVVTGMGVAAPNGSGRESFWNSLVNGRSGITLVSDFSAEKLNSNVCGTVKDLDIAKMLPPRIVKRADRFVHFGLCTSLMALDDAGLDPATMRKDRAGICIGSGLGGLPFHEEQILLAQKKGLNRADPLCVPKISPNSVSSNVAIMFGFTGPNIAVSTACSSGTDAMGMGLKMIRDDDADIVLAGGVEAPLTFFTFVAYSNLRALSRNERPEKASRPFDRKRDGFVLGEGAAVMVMEELSHAVRRGASIYGEVAGYANNSGAHNVIAPEPSGRDGAAAIRRALADSDQRPEEVDYINAHGTSTPVSDLAETRAIKHAFGDRAYNIPVSSIKSMIGHTIGAAGAIDAVACLMAIRNNTIPPTTNYENPDPECDLDYVPNRSRPARVNTVISNSFGFGNNNSCIVLRRCREEKGW